MVSTPTTRLRLERQGLGENLNSWGETKLNDALSRIDEAIAGVEAITISGTSTTLTSVNYATDQSRKACLVLTGTLTANSTITVPGVEKQYVVVNNTTQATYSLTIKTAAGSGYVLRPGPQQVYCNGTDVFRATPRLDQVPLPTSSVDLNSQKITGLGAPTLGTDATTKTYVDAADAATVTAMAASATAAAGSASAASTSAGNAAGSATAAATSATNSANSATASANSASAAATSASNAAGSATAAANSAASISGGPVTSVNSLTGVVTLTAASLGAAPLASPTFTGTPAAPTATAATSTTQIATTAFVTTADNLKANLASPTFTGTPAAPTAAAATNTTQIATTAFVTTAASTKADLASPTFTGTPAAPTASAGTNTTQLATTAFVTANHAALATVNTFTAAVRGSIVALTDAATIAVNAALGNYFSVTLGGNRTLGNPTNLVAGQGGSIIITQDGTGSRTLAYGSNWKFAGGTAPVLTTTAAAVDRIDYLVVSGSLIHASLTKDIK